MVDVEKFLKENRGLVESLVSKFYLDTPKFSRDDLVQEANLATVRAINKFDPSKGNKLSTYVYSSVWRSCRDFVRKNKHDLYKTGYHQTQDWKDDQDNPVEITEGPVPTGQFGTIEGPMAIRADTENSETGETFSSAIPSGELGPLESFIKQEQYDILREEISALPKREREIINARYFEDKKMSEIARDQGVTRQRINQISKRAFNKLHDAVKDRLGDEILI